MGKSICSLVIAELSNVAVMMHGKRGNVVQMDVMRESDVRSDKRHVDEAAPSLAFKLSLWRPRAGPLCISDLQAWGTVSTQMEHQSEIHPGPRRVCLC